VICPLFQVSKPEIRDFILLENGMQMEKMCDEKRALIKDAAKRLTGYKRREYQAQITLDFFGGNARKAEREMGWSRKTVDKALKELESGIRCIDNFQARGRKKTEATLPNIEKDIRSLAEPQTQADPVCQLYER